MVPTTVVVQLAVPAVRVSDDCVVGATALMSGATALEDSASASAMVKVDAVPNPPRMPAVEVELPGEMVKMLVPERGDLRTHLGLGSLAQADGQDDGGDADQDAQHGQGRAQPVDCGPR